MGTPASPGGSAAAWDLERAYDEHGGPLYAFACSALGDRGAAEDAVQETFVKAWRARAGYDPARASVRTWLFGIARNVVIDALRARSRRVVPIALEDRHDRAERGDVAEAVAAALTVHEALARLSVAHREVLVRVHLQGLACQEVAGELDIPVGTVRTRLFYGLRALRAALDETRDRAEI
ncbi:MAG TPA: sigma-70 family RNA polymerase sigma factor [Mycobacteriales bacterium]|jgi:RNA polymerase sigma-70 factor (ECF subfamily)|nr:sigma-70 family RNA polymerase sigma factor [Mycobacteriales bacterium]